MWAGPPRRRTGDTFRVHSPKKPALIVGFLLLKWCGPVRLGGEPATLSDSISQKNPRLSWVFSYCSGVGRDRTGDTRIFSPLLYRLSYRTIPLKADANIRTYPVCSEFIHRFFGIFGCLLFPLFNFTFPSP